MEKTYEQDYEFSQGFMTDIAGLLQVCVKNDTDNINLEFEIEGQTLSVDINFKIL